MSRATVYNTLDLLVECDLVSKHQFGRNLAQYEKSYGYKQHDHVICAECHTGSRIFAILESRTFKTMIGDLLNFKIMHHSLKFIRDLWRLPSKTESRGARIIFFNQ